ncbi:Asp23/Gls24 family envelope stress response protein [Weissella viridescens]|uniref:Stress response regulator gls24 homolog n=1 Tax=Weissella viridescens TaxID=1629 RepID=A0A3P2RCU6_WEIVI|nr:Asp23/Gls24 family envelope stress response protein [Weissella viridescens]RRG17596.1 Asp23/Gls24 family envelope stress response protein [Weissella viridescens]
MTDTKTNTPAKTNEVSGKLTFDDKVIQKIIGISLDKVDGLLNVDGGFFSNIADKLVNTDKTTAGINTEVGQKQVAADMQIVVEYGKDVRAIYNEMKELVAKNLKEMTGLDLVEFNVEVIDIKSKAQYEADSQSLQDKVTNATKKSDDDKSKDTKSADADKSETPRVQ